MNTKMFEVASSTATQNGNYCNKLVNKSVIEIQTEFGTISQERQKTLYLFTKTPNQVGFKANLNLDLFDIIEKPFTIINEDGNEETIMLSYAYPKGV